jgi:hypothetical protein
MWKIFDVNAAARCKFWCIASSEIYNLFVFLFIDFLYHWNRLQGYDGKLAFHILSKIHTDMKSKKAMMASMAHKQHEELLIRSGAAHKQHEDSFSPSNYVLKWLKKCLEQHQLQKELANRKKKQHSKVSLITPRRPLHKPTLSAAGASGGGGGGIGPSASFHG